MNATPTNADPAELARFGQMAASWWDPNGSSRALHDLNPVRLEFVRQRARLAGARVLDVGCGGGLFSETLAASGASVVGIDLAPEVLGVARLHLLESGRQVDYRESGAEALAAAEPASYDVVACMEMLEHVPDPAAVVQACADLLKPGGQLFLSTINRTPAAFALAIVGAEYVARLLPRGTHRYQQFLRPSELDTALRRSGLVLREVRGLAYEPVLRRAWLSRSTAVNYLMHAEKPA
ncbi:MAG TPA: bifunctional 2-polyprenyl-6-hydroxyphenol methylase/3-demethylubiquinol 3-O-methyltransferase UbiG [Pseudomonadota bacterium]|nr:bifunctional 2-polyprenyl-6-hydroxyphenol methylase/3-demethylubiquinol 3-O-methyltransferase UbiG [Xanthomonadales bacterium]HQX25628.1 bifunctional 2-polyprenyl-6-hydroxyphenol methylase/3-demethylubiquinol 3-O-methyltransferase UbiG [Pseudomonadota bacterium]HRA36394.1 bifunctional 2-polyprenyl-6-hydroxyphenol methylase/3-demethylubiquinol 3-O-methyltransferase UbiG [Pseudomonadota bacterium]